LITALFSVLFSVLIFLQGIAVHAAGTNMPPPVTNSTPPVTNSTITSELFTDHMVLQRDMPVPVWGEVKPGEEVTVEFAGQKKSAKADASGKWMVKLDPLAASSEPREMIVRSADQNWKITDVLVGEVWIASGQSNMGYSVNGVTNALAEIAAADVPGVRVFTVPNKGSLTLKPAVSGAWQVCSPETAGHFTAVGYFFARDLFQKLGVPVGIVHSSFGGTPAEAWTSREGLNAVPELKAMADEQIAMMEKAPADQAAWPAAMAAWQAANGVEDKTNTGFAAGWAAPDFDDSAWSNATAPFNIASAFKATNGGICWARKEVTLPASAAGKRARVSLGYMAEQYDMVYFNGVEVAREGTNPPGFYSSPRVVNIPAKVLKEGTNLIALRLASYTPSGGIMVKGESMEFPVADPKSIDDTWKVAWERQFPRFSKEVLETRPKINPSKLQNTSAALFNAMIYPVIPYAIRGVIWYQGESNSGPTVDRAEQYKVLFPVMIADWRGRWGEGNFPFYFVQLANNGKSNRTHRASGWSVVQEAQRQTLAKVPNTGMAVAIDVGSDITIHPTNKQDVGQRLALWARAKTYGEKGIIYQSPLFTSHAVEGDRIRVRFDTEGSPLMIGKKEGLHNAVEAPEAKLDWFEIAGADGNYQWADAVIDGDSVVVSSPEVKSPVSVRYAWAGNPEGCNLYNKAGLPASPFRTDATVKNPATNP
jgi:sialate O-acetylesterase